MNVNNIATKITKHVDLIGGVVGASAFGFDNLMDNVQRIPEHGHIPDIGYTFRTFFKGAVGAKLKDAIMLYVVGYGAEALGYPKYGKPIKKFAEGYTKGLAAQHVLHFSTHDDSGSFPRGSPRRNARSTGVRRNPMQSQFAVM